MTRTEHQHPPRRTIRKPITAVLGGVVLAASVMFGTAVGPAAAETPAEILTNVCSRYVPNPTSSSFTDCSTRVLTDALLNGVNLNYAYLHGAHLTGANLTDATLNDANLNVAHLHNANLTSANLNRATMSGAWLNGANLTDANLTSANLNGTNLTSTNLNRTTLNRTTLNGANLTDANLTEANLTEANLTEANLDGTNLTNANLDGANLNRANLTSTTLDGTNLTSANLDGATLTGSSLIPANVTVPATSTAGATVTWTTPTMPTGLTFGACDHASGALFPVGATIVTCTVTSLRNGYPTTGSGTFTVTTSPYLEAPSFINPPAGPLTAVAGTPFTPYTFTVAGTPDLVLTATDLPDWLDFSPTGVLTGTPPAAGSFPFTVIAANGTAPDATLEVTVTVTAAPVVDPPATGSLGSLGSIFGS